MPSFRLMLFGCLAALLAGCTHVQLQKDMVNQATTVGDLQIQQVMNNLAMFVYNYDSMPYFCYPNQGATIVTDQASAGGTATWGRPVTTGATPTTAPRRFTDFLLTALGLSASAQRSQQESFTLTPINDPRKLELMRCAYQTAVSNCGYGTPPRSCPDSQARFNTFYTGSPDGKISQLTSGIVTSDCLKGVCWFHVGCEKDVPKDCCCIYVGHYCGVYVWVTAEGRNELTKLTLAILDYAVHEPPVQLTKDVTYYIDPLGLPTNQKAGVGIVKATIGVNEQPSSLLNIPPAQEVDLEQQLQERIRRLTALLNTTENAQQKKDLTDEIEDARQKLYFLDQQLRNGGLKEQFLPPGAAPAPPYSIIPGLQQQINANSAPAVLPSPQ